MPAGEPYYVIWRLILLAATAHIYHHDNTASLFTRVICLRQSVESYVCQSANIALRLLVTSIDAAGDINELRHCRERDQAVRRYGINIQSRRLVITVWRLLSATFTCHE